MAEPEKNMTSLSDVQVTISKPRRVLHFSDGVEEEFEEEQLSNIQTTHDTKPPVDPKTLSWGPWLSYKALSSGEKVVDAIDYVGEGLAIFFGITTPKYQIEIDAYERLQEEKRQTDEASGWIANGTDGAIPLVMSQPRKI